MYVLNLFAVLISMVALLAVVNAKWLKLPSTIAMTIGGLLVSLALSGLSSAGLPVAQRAIIALKGIDFDTVVFLWMLSFLLFAGALGVDSHELWHLRVPVVTFALVSTLLSIVIVGLGVYVLLDALGLPIPLVYALLFGALISPTDPVAVLGMLKHAKVPDRIETIVAGESLFNDGVGVVAVTLLSAIAFGGGEHVEASFGGVTLFFLQEVVGGIALGMVMGTAGLWLMRQVDDFITESLVSLALIFALTSTAQLLHVSAPLAAVAAGLLVGGLTDRNQNVLTSKERFESLWHLIDELLNLALFALLAFEIVVVQFTGKEFVAGVLAIPIVLIARVISVQVPMWLLERRHVFDPFTRLLMVWGGLRGALSVALAFTLPPGDMRNLFLVITYCVVVFSIVVQGLTVPAVARRAARAAELPTG